MESPGILKDFWNKVQTLLQLPDVSIILLALRELALSDGQTDIQALQGLGIQTWYHDHRHYARAAESLLVWFVRQLRFREADGRYNLWKTLDMPDGPNGYNQGYVRQCKHI